MMICIQRTVSGPYLTFVPFLILFKELHVQLARILKEKQFKRNERLKKVPK